MDGDGSDAPVVDGARHTGSSEGDEAWPPPRVLGRHVGDAPGPALVIFGGVHGNEPAGVQAARRVLRTLARVKPRMRGELLALSGNRGALAARRRFLDRDLNRGWHAPDIDALRTRGADPDVHEHVEQLEILGHVDDLALRAEGRLTLFDMHTTSADGPPFAGMCDSYRNRRLASHLPVPTIIGLNKLVPGAMLDYLHAQGHTCVSVEGGRHEAPETCARLEAAVWLVLVGAGLVDARDVPDYQAHRDLLAQACAGLPRIIHTQYRHRITQDQNFVMDPGYQSFQRVRRGQRLARDRHGDVVAPWTGRLLMPLYQAEGNDGFFLAREYSRTRLWLADLLRIPLRRPRRVRHPS